MFENNQLQPNPQPSQGPVRAHLRDISLRTRLIVVTILITAFVAIALGYFSYVRTQQSQTFLRDQLKTNIGQQAEYQIQNTALTTANQIDQLLASVTEDLLTEANYLQNIQKQKDLLSPTSYWDAHQKLTRLSTGQWDNPNSDLSSVLVPSNVELTDEEMAKINSYTYLDFFSPEMLKKKSNIVATYFISSNGVTIYYPNIDLAHVVGDFNATSQAFYQIATPANDPKRLPVWSVPYQDPAKKGLIVTNSFPIYDQQDNFIGVIGVDIQLASIATRITNLKVSDSGYAFLIDAEGHIIALPNQGYIDFGVTAIKVPIGEPIRQSIFGQGSEVLQVITREMAAGKRGIATAVINGHENYIAFAPLPSVGYSLGVIVPTAVLNASYISTDLELNNQTRQTLNLSWLILGLVLLVATFISYTAGRLLTNPLNALTTAAKKIAAGDFSVQADENFNDEIGTLGKAFNNMTARLLDSISHLEARVTERTNEFMILNEKNQRQATQLRAVAEIARDVTSLKDLEDLLPEITRYISTAFDFYHVGIFLLDADREYAVLKAANSEGGQRMLARNHRLKVGQLGIVGFVTQTGQSRIVLNVGEDAIFFNNTDLPETRSELALPLKIGDEIIGALDVQSIQNNAFTTSDVDILGLLSDQICIAIQNSRLYDETRLALAEAQNIYTRSALASWREINRQSAISGFRYINGIVEPLRPDNAGEITPIENGSLTIPINFRGQSLGALNIRQPGRTQPWSDSETRLYRSIVERLSFALENARLYVDAQKRASKERVIGEIGSKISSSVNLDNILRIVVEELGRTLPGSDVSVQFEESNLKNQGVPNDR